MRQLKYLLLVAAVALSIVGCRKTIEVSFGSASQELDAQGGSIELALKSNGEWTIDPTAEWIAITPMSGNGDATLTLTAEANTTGEPRSAEVKAVTKDNTATLTLTQAVLENYVRVTPKEILCGEEGGAFDIVLSTNVDWFVSAPAWITCSSTQGSGDARITMTVSPIDTEYDVAESREAQVFFGNLSVSEMVHVVQTVEPVLGIELTPNNLRFAYTGETKTIAVSTEDDWTVTFEDNWLALSQTEGQGNAEISVTVDENPLYTDRASVVLFTTTGGVQTVLTVSQEAAPDPHFLEVSPREIEFGKDGGEREITIGCDTDWVFDMDCPWLSLSQMSGTGNATVVLTAEPNEVTELRSVEFSIKSGHLSYGISVIQEPGDDLLFVTFDSDTLVLAYTGGLQHVQLTSNTTWELESPTWIGLGANTSGEGDASFDLIIDSNSSPDDRVGSVRAIHNGQLLATLTVVQEGKPNLLEVDVTQLDVRPEGGDYEIQVTANQAWRVVTNEDWLHCNPQYGFANGSFTITVDALQWARPRTGYIKVSGETGIDVMITVDQH